MTDKELCACGHPQSYPIPHEHDMTARELRIYFKLKGELNKRDWWLTYLLEMVSASAITGQALNPAEFREYFFKAIAGEEPPKVKQSKVDCSGYAECVESEL